MYIVCFFRQQFLCIQSSNGPRKFSQRIISCFWILLQPLISNQTTTPFFKAHVFGLPNAFKKFFYWIRGFSNVNWHSWLAMSSIKVPCSSLWGKYLFFKNKIISLTFLASFVNPCKILLKLGIQLAYCMHTFCANCMHFEPITANNILLFHSIMHASIA